SPCGRRRSSCEHQDHRAPESSERVCPCPCIGYRRPASLRRTSSGRSGCRRRCAFTILQWGRGSVSTQTNALIRPEVALVQTSGCPPTPHWVDRGMSSDENLRNAEVPPGSQQKCVHFQASDHRRYWRAGKRQTRL